ncbi:MAG TPA: DUF1802 family protein [Nitrospiria bacterium]|nr:DUF1802 family protein [Nitrospiria bacterium]
MLSENSVAFKEWAVVVQALLSGEQTVIFRKGGIHEREGEFSVDHREFFLFPTYTHQQVSKVRPKAGRGFEGLEKSRPPEGWIRLEGYASVEENRLIGDPEVLDRLSGEHILSPAALSERFHQDIPGIHLLMVRVYRFGPEILQMRSEYGGCRSWVEFDRSLSTSGARKVLEDADFEKRREAILGCL